ncbi:MAG: DUF1361 domain-containing protein [bacterium]
MSALITWVGWNIFLAAIPLGAAYIFSFLYSYDASKEKKIYTYLKYSFLPIVFLIWLAFLPNTCYLITEWRHLLGSIVHSPHRTVQNYDSNRDVLVWFGIRMLFYIAYSGIGMLLFVLSTRPIWRIVKQMKIKAVWVAIPFFFINALGVYLGLIPRFNSWDIMHRPSVIINEILRVFQRSHLIGLVIGLALFLWLVYLFFDIWIDGFKERVKSKELNSDRNN